MKKILLIILLVFAILMFGLIGLAGLAVYLGHKQTALLSKPPKHGTEFVVKADLSRMQGGANAFAVLKEPLRKRFLEFGPRIFMKPLSASRIRVDVPITNAVDVGTASNLLSQRGWLEFRLVHPDSAAFIERGVVPPGYEVLKQEMNGFGDKTRIKRFVVKKKPEPGLTGGIIKSAVVTRGNLGEPEIDFTLTQEGAVAFAKVTRENIGRRLAIVLDGRLYSAPVIQSAIETGDGQLTGQFTPMEARLLANVLSSALPVPVTVLESKTF